MNHLLSTRTAINLSTKTTELLETLNKANDELQEELIHLQLAKAGIEETSEWVKHPEHLEQDIRETQEEIHLVFGMIKQVEHFIQTIDSTNE